MARAPRSDGKFIDNIFPCDISSLCFDPQAKNMDPEFKKAIAQVKSWRRPSEWCKNPTLTKDDASPGDIEQGQLGDCWILSALGVVAVRPQILKHLFVKIDPKRGEYTLRFYREGKWEEVTIDDRIPCGQDGLPVFAHCIDPEEIWVPIIEKGLAKLLGTYEALDGGYLEEAIVMFTGGRPEKVTVNNWKGKDVFEETSADLWHKLLTYYTEGHMMGAAICSGKELPNQSTGLVSGHAYGILDVRETTDKKFKLVKLRNPWGSFEWKGKWSDGSREWTKQYIDDLKQTSGDDGTFWMELTDFRKYFDKITVCRIFNLRLFTLQSPLSTDADKTLFGNVNWHRAKFECEWNDSNAGGILNDSTYGQNPHLKLSVTEPGRMFFLISQPALTTQAESRYYRTGIGFAIQKGTVDKKGIVRLPTAQDESIFVQNPVRNRYNSAHLMVKQGPYVIVPFTDYPNRKTKFVFEIYGEKQFQATVLLPEDKTACRDVPPSARASDGASLPQRMARMSVQQQPAEPSARSPARDSPKPDGASRRIEATRDVPARAARPSNPTATRSHAAVGVAPNPPRERAAPPPARGSPAKTTTTTSSPQRSSPSVKKAATAKPSPPAMQRSAKPAAAPKDDRFTTTSMMFYRK